MSRYQNLVYDLGVDITALKEALDTFNRILTTLGPDDKEEWDKLEQLYEAISMTALNVRVTGSMIEDHKVEVMGKKAILVEETERKKVRLD